MVINPNRALTPLPGWSRLVSSRVSSTSKNLRDTATTTRNKGSPVRKRASTRPPPHRPFAFFSIRCAHLRWGEKIKSIFLLIGARFLTLQWLRLANYGVRISEANLLEKSVKRASAGGEANDRNLVGLGLRSHGDHPPPPQLHKFPFFWKEIFLLFYSVTSITVLWNSQSNIKFLESYNTPSCPRHRSTNSSIGVGRSGRFDHHQIRFAHKSANSSSLFQ